jgi:hypothetical protein
MFCTRRKGEATTKKKWFRAFDGMETSHGGMGEGVVRRSREGRKYVTADRRDCNRDGGRKKLMRRSKDTRIAG